MPNSKASLAKFKNILAALMPRAKGKLEAAPVPAAMPAYPPGDIASAGDNAAMRAMINQMPVGSTGTFQGAPIEIYNLPQREDLYSGKYNQDLIAAYLKTKSGMAPPKSFRGVSSNRSTGKAPQR